MSTNVNPPQPVYDGFRRSDRILLIIILVLVAIELFLRILGWLT